VKGNKFFIFLFYKLSLLEVNSKSSHFSTQKGMTQKNKKKFKDVKKTEKIRKKIKSVRKCPEDLFILNNKEKQNKTLFLLTNTINNFFGDLKKL
jgi:hypothetical protein